MANAGKSQLGALLLLLAMLGGYGVWNYQRNLEAEAQLVRPYASYSDEQLEQLLAAYEEQAGALAARYESQSKRRASTRDVALDFGLTGYALNLPDGRVEVLACGDADALDRLAAWLERGPPQASVTEVACETVPVEDRQGFVTG